MTWRGRQRDERSSFFFSIESFLCPLFFAHCRWSPLRPRSIIHHREPFPLRAQHGLRTSHYARASMGATSSLTLWVTDDVNEGSSAGSSTRSSTGSSAGFSGEFRSIRFRLHDAWTPLQRDSPLLSALLSPWLNLENNPGDLMLCAAWIPCQNSLSRKCKHCRRP